jgi:Cof subfamily protein (haloacid dehalogenase superfamily)
LASDKSANRAKDVSVRPDIRLLVADVDGTLLTGDKILTDAAKDVVRELHDAGILFALTSGRPPRGIAMLIEPLALRSVIAGFNGGVFVNPDLSVIECHVLDAATAKHALELILDQGLDAWVYTEDEWLIRDQNAPRVAREAWTVKFDAKVVPSFTDAQLAHAVKIVGVSDDLDLVATCEKLVQSALGEKVSAARSQPYYLDITNPKANKGTVVTTLSRCMNIPPAQIATMGDMPNDVLMFRKCGLSIAMGNSNDEVRAQANAVTDSNENEGFAKGVRAFVLNGASRQSAKKPPT